MRLHRNSVLFATGAQGSIARNYVSWASERHAERVAVAAAAAPSSRPCAACDETSYVPWGVSQDDVVFCGDCLERAAPPSPYDELGGNG